METTGISETTSAATPATTEPATSGSGDFQTFLTLLTAQMRNQDPMKPMDSTEFVAQLASFSAVEQQIETNAKLAELIGMNGGNRSVTLTDWIGKEVRREGSTEFTNRPIEVAVTIPASADAARLVVRDQNANIVFEKALDTSANTTFWNGETSGEGPAPSGRYSFDVESFAADDQIDSRAGTVFDVVSEVRLDQGNTVLMFNDGASLDAEQATAVRISQN